MKHYKYSIGLLVILAFGLMASCKSQVDAGLSTALKNESYRVQEKGAPVLTSLVIEGGAASTKNHKLSVTLSGQDDLGVDQFLLSTSSSKPSYFDLAWENLSGTPKSFTKTTSFDVSGSTGKVVIYAWLNDVDAKISSPLSASILLE